MEQPQVECHSKSEIQPEPNPRLDYLDIARFIAIFFMILSHVQLLYATFNFIISPVGIFFELMAGPPAAPVFMFTMGFLMVLRKNPTEISVTRGIKIFIAGVLLNLLRWIFPLLITMILQKSYLQNYLGDESPTVLIFYLLFQVDILLLAGVAYALIAIILRIDKKRLPLIVFLIVAFISPYLWGISTGILPVDLGLNILWGDNYNHVFFPLFPWLCFPIFGAWIGLYLKQLRENQREAVIGTRIFVIGISFFSIGLLITVFNIDYHIGDYYRSGPGAIILYSGFILLWILLLNRIIQKIPEQGKKMIRFVSVNLTSIYCIHWVILGWLLLVIPPNQMEGGIMFGFFSLVFMISVILSKYIRIKL